MWTPGRLRAVRFGILAVHVALMLVALRHAFVTVDEPGHVAAGLSYWRTGRFFVYRVNPPLTKLVATAPLLLADARGGAYPIEDDPKTRAEWKAGPMFIRENADRLFDLVCLARLAGVGWTVLGALLVYDWSRSLYGEGAGLLSMSLWCFDPNILGHGSLVTADVPCAVMALAAARAYWQFHGDPSWRRALIAGVLLGLASLTKFTLLLFFVLWPLLWLYAAARRRRLAPRGTGRLAVALLVAIYIINLAYGFDGSLRRLGEYSFMSRTFTGPDAPPGEPGNRFRGTTLGEVPVPLPADVLLGIDIQRKDFEAGWRSYLAGEWRREGWYHYYLFALAWKLPLGTIALLLGGVAAHALARDRPREGSYLILNALAFFALISSQVGFSHHMRYILVALPFLMITAGRLATPHGPRRLGFRALILALLACSVASTLRVFPHEISYFNEAAGGPERGHELLVDSNIDWGQDLKDLKDWIDAHPEAQPLRIAYFNTVDPAILGIRYSLPPMIWSDPSGKTTPGEGGPEPGDFAISVNFLRGIEFHTFNGKGDTTFVHANAYTYFQKFKPIARAGYSIYIYRVTREQADMARAELGLPPLGRAGSR